MTPGKAIRKHCVECIGSVYEVKDCKGDQLLDGTSCHFYKYRLGTGRPSVKTIRKFCLHCMGESYLLVELCTTIKCLLHPYRFGKNPAFVLSDDKKEELALRLKTAREDKGFFR